MFDDPVFRYRRCVDTSLQGRDLARRTWDKLIIFDTKWLVDLYPRITLAELMFNNDEMEVSLFHTFPTHA